MASLKQRNAAFQDNIAARRGAAPVVTSTIEVSTLNKIKFIHLFL